MGLMGLTGNVGLANHLLSALLPGTSDLYARAGTALTVESAGRAYIRFAGDVGLRESINWFRAEDPEAQGIHPALVRIFNEEAPRWSRNIEKAYGMDVRFKGLDLLDQMATGALVMCAAIHHASLEPCYTLWKQIPQIRPVPEAKNYLKSSFARKSGMGALLAGSGFVFVDRANKDPAHFGEVFLPRLRSTMEEYGLWPLIFIMAGRPPVAYNVDGSIARPGLFSKAQKKPDEYLDLGIIISALMVARATKKTVHIPLIVTEGEHLVKPKVSKDISLPEPVTRGQTVTHRIVGVLEITRKTLIRTAKEEMVRLFKEATGIEEYLIRTVRKSGERHGMMDAASRFAEQARANERFFITADRNRSLHPRLTPANLGKELKGLPEIHDLLFLDPSRPSDESYRYAAERGLLTLLANPDPERLGATLGAVTTLVGAAEYRRW